MIFSVSPLVQSTSPVICTGLKEMKMDGMNKQQRQGQSCELLTDRPYKLTVIECKNIIRFIMCLVSWCHLCRHLTTVHLAFTYFLPVSIMCFYLAHSYILTCAMNLHLSHHKDHSVLDHASVLYISSPGLPWIILLWFWKIIMFKPWVKLLHWATQKTLASNIQSPMHRVPAPICRGSDSK